MTTPLPITSAHTPPLPDSILSQDFSHHVLQTITRAIAVQQIPAPTFAENVRATYVADQFRALGLVDVSIDEVFNVYGLLKGTGDGRALMISAHTDTVFPSETDLKIQHEGNLIYGAGLGDNSLGVAGLLFLTEFLQQESFDIPCDIWFVAPSREEGLGDLGGMKAAFKRLQPSLKAVINLEGMAFGFIYNGGIAVRRLHITTKAEGGHSWLQFGRPSAVHSLMAIGAKIGTIHPPNNPRTTYNIGVIEGGHSVNSIATDAGMWLDMRSESAEALSKLEAHVRQIVAHSVQDGVQFAIEVVGDRPAGHISDDHPLVQMAQGALSLVGMTSSLETGSTDGNVPLAAGCPAVTIGLARGGNAHRLDEYIDPKPLADGLRQLVALTLWAGQWNG
jgi:acetylornithine deacetylase/succinyl-diaminopimelate desuccinylase-like protein